MSQPWCVQERGDRFHHCFPNHERIHMSYDVVNSSLCMYRTMSPAEIMHGILFPTVPC